MFNKEKSFHSARKQKAYLRYSALLMNSSQSTSEVLFKRSRYTGSCLHWVLTELALVGARAREIKGRMVKW